MCWLSNVKDLVTIAAGLTGIFVALRGLSTWRRQLKGNQQHEVARKLLKSVFLLREELRSFRHPFISADEIAAAQAPRNDGSPEGDTDLTSKWERGVYSERWKPVLAAATEFRTAALETEAVLGSEAVTALERLQKLLAELAVAAHEYLRYSERAAKHTATTEKIKEGYRLKVHAASKDDEFGRELDEAIKAVETFVRGYLSK